jgi:TPR repeat protein
MRRPSTRRYGYLLLLTFVFLAGPVLGGPAEARDPLWEQLPWDDRLGVSWYEQKAEAGDPLAALRAGQMHEQGIGVPADPKEAARWYEMAAEAGHPLAQFKTARAWETGALGGRDFAKAARLYRAAAEQGVGLASFNLAAMLEAGRGVARDRERAAELYAQAWRQGVPEAGLSLASLKLTGPEQDLLGAYAWLAAASAAGVPQAEAQRARLAEILGPDMVAEAAARELPSLGSDRQG